MTSFEDAQDLAHHLRTFARAYPEDVFIPPSKERLIAVHEWLETQGGTLDAISAHVMRTQAVPRFIEAAEAIESLAEDLREAWKVIDVLWGEMPANEVDWLRDNRPEVITYCKRVHMKLWHPDE